MNKDKFLKDINSVDIRYSTLEEYLIEYPMIMNWTLDSLIDSSQKSYEVLANAFVWRKTPEGHMYWKGKHDELEALDMCVYTQVIKRKEKPKCDCGATISNAPVHSDWCAIKEEDNDYL